MRKYWKSIEEFQGKNDNISEENSDLTPEFLNEDFLNTTASRRNFLKAFGYSVSAAALLSACKRPVINAIPYAVHPPEITPGRALYYASSYFDGHEYAAIIVKTRDGRPIKIEGNALSAFNNEGTTARIQASVLSLYDDARLKAPLISNSAASWAETDAQILNGLETINSEGGEISLLTSTINSPSTIKVINEFASRFKNFRWVQYDAISYSAILEANLLSFGKAVIPDYNFQNADYVVSFNADFLATWLSPIHFIPKYASRRKLNDKNQNMLRHVQVESALTTTGSNADKRIRIKPSEEKAILSDLYNMIAEKTGGQKISGLSGITDVSWVASELVASKGKSIVISGTNSIEIQLIVNGINNLLGNYQVCIDLNHNLNIASGSDRNMDLLVNDMNAGKIKAIFLYNVNPVYDYPGFQEALKKTDLSVNMAWKMNETVGETKFECPVNHFLESWNDTEIIPGQLSLSQPCINPLFNTRSFQDSLLKWSQNQTLWHDYLMSNWQEEFLPKSGKTNFLNFWDETLGKGVFNYDTVSGEPLQFRNEVLKDAFNTKNASTEGYEIIFIESVSMGTGMHANNPWLMELPDPVSRHSWDNIASFSPSDATKLGISNGDLITLADGLVLPAFVQPGQAESTIAVALGYGHSKSGPVANNVGVNVYPFIKVQDGSRFYGMSSSSPVKSLENRQLALTQEYNSMDGRPIVRETVFSEFQKNPASGNEMHEEFVSKHRTLYPDKVYDGFHWGMAIDLNACVGCNTCVIACQAENNIPVVGKDQVTRRRIMHWLKIDRYYSDTPDDPKVYFQPLPCMHCDNAPCENVCPVSATNHSSEGLNQMSYNRCLGTKYCINNCPYKVRRFNWYRYTNNKAFDFNTASDLGRLVLNPDVTVRERGVVEKCTFCVQRIQDKKLQAKLENRVIEDFEIKTACMQACPAGAIIFGNLNDRNSMVSKLMENPRNYNLLEELHTLPSVGYLTKVWKDEDTKS